MPNGLCKGGFAVVAVGGGVDEGDALLMQGLGGLLADCDVDDGWLVGFQAA